MSSFLPLISSTESSIETGLVQEKKSGNKYDVLINGKLQSLRSAVPSSLKRGERVVINRTKHERYIIGTTNRSGSSKSIREEIVING